MSTNRTAVVRVLNVVSVAVRHTSAYAATLIGARIPFVRRRFLRTSLSGPVRFRMALEELGGSFIKLGQMLALQPDILSLEYCDALFSLLDRVTPFPYADVERTFVEEFGRSPDELFDTFDDQPLATASVGQVHVATLDGRKLAVKVQRPNVQIDFAGDIRLILAATATIRRLRLTPLQWLIDPLEEFAQWTREELDYRVEARYMERLRRNAHDNAAECIPEVIASLTSRRTLVAEFLEGQTLLACLRARHDGGCGTRGRVGDVEVDAHVVARHIIDNFLSSVFRHGMFHADLHPANLLVLRGNLVGYIDFGITGVISAYSRRHLVALTLAYTSGDLDGMAEAFFRVCRITDADSPRAFRRGLQEIAEGWYARDLGRCRPQKNFTLVMLDMLQLSRRAGVWPDRDVIKYIRSVIAIDGLITRLAPGFDTSRYLATGCADHLRWHMRRSLLAYDALADIAAATGHIVRDGADRSAKALTRATDTGVSARMQVQAAAADAPGQWGRDAVFLGLIALVAGAAGSAAPRHANAFDLFTAAVGVVALASIKLVLVFRRAARPPCPEEAPMQQRSGSCAT